LIQAPYGSGRRLFVVPDEISTSKGVNTSNQGERDSAACQEQPTVTSNVTAEKLTIERWETSRLIPYARRLRKNDKAVDRMVAAIREFGFKVPLLIRGTGEIIDGHLRLKAARKLGMTEVPVILCDEWSEAQVKAFRLQVQRSATWAEFDLELVAIEMQELKALDFDLDLTGFDPTEIDKFLLSDPKKQSADSAQTPPKNAVTQLGDLWQCGEHRVLCGDATKAEAVARLLGERKPQLMVTDPPWGIELDSEWRDLAGLNGTADPKKQRTEGHTATTISGDTRADWSDAFALVPSLEVAYVWHASKFTREVLNGLLRIGFIHFQQIIWNKGRPVLMRTHYWFSHEPCWYVRKKNAPWFGKPGENSTVWDSPSPKVFMGGSDEDKFDHPTQKSTQLYRTPLLNHTRRGELVYDPFLGSGTALEVAELTERVCCGLEIDPKFVDLVIERWQKLTGKQAVLDADGRCFEEISKERAQLWEVPSCPDPD
jgi:DNA modification methylase